MKTSPVRYQTEPSDSRMNGKGLCGGSSEWMLVLARYRWYHNNKSTVYLRLILVGRHSDKVGLSMELVVKTLHGWLLIGRYCIKRFSISKWKWGSAWSQRPTGFFLRSHSGVVGNFVESSLSSQVVLISWLQQWHQISLLWLRVINKLPADILYNSVHADLVAAGFMGDRDMTAHRVV